MYMCVHLVTLYLWRSEGLVGVYSLHHIWVQDWTQLSGLVASGLFPHPFAFVVVCGSKLKLRHSFPLENFIQLWNVRCFSAFSTSSKIEMSTTGEMAWQLRTLTAFLEDLGSFSSTHMVASSGLSGLCGHFSTVVHLHICRQNSHIHKKILKIEIISKTCKF